ncbi:hypothetical protein C8R48DRAFT_702845 [Suillus tomentosus]|nr:hypothetical protein C8R48DRAFT_702845 [Suillus tomentosus]
MIPACSSEHTRVPSLLMISSDFRHKGESISTSFYLCTCKVVATELRALQTKDCSCHENFKFESSHLDADGDDI